MNETHKLSAQQFGDEAGHYMYEQLDEQGKLEAQELADVITQSLLDDLACRRQQASEFSEAGGDYRKAPTVSPSSMWKDVVVPTTRKECEVYGLFLATGLVLLIRDSSGLSLHELSEALDFQHATRLNCHLQNIQHYEAGVNDWATKFIAQGAGALVNYWLGSARSYQLPINEQHPIVLQLEKAGWRGVREAWIKELVQPGSPSLASLESILGEGRPRTAEDFIRLTHSMLDWMMSQVAKLVEELSKPESTLRRKVEAAILDAMSQAIQRVMEALREYIGDYHSIADPQGIGFDAKKALAWSILVDHKYEDAHRPLKELAVEAGISYHYVREFGVRYRFLPKRGRPPKLLK